MSRKTGIKKSLRPSERESITAYTSRFSAKLNFEDKARARKILRIALITVIIAALVYTGYFFTDLLIRFTEIPTEIHIAPEAASKWISFLTIRP